MAFCRDAIPEPRRQSVEIRKIELAQPTVAGLSMTAATLCDAAKYQEAIDLLSQAVATTTPDPKLELQLQGIRTAKQHHDEIVARLSRC